MCVERYQGKIEDKNIKEFDLGNFVTEFRPYKAGSSSEKRIQWEKINPRPQITESIISLNFSYNDLQGFAKGRERVVSMRGLGKGSRFYLFWALV